MSYVQVPIHFFSSALTILQVYVHYMYRETGIKNKMHLGVVVFVTTLIIRFH